MGTHTMRAPQPASPFRMKKKLRSFRPAAIAACGLSVLFSSCVGTGTTGGGGGSSYVGEVGQPYPNIGSYIAVDAFSGHVALAHAPNQRRPVASLTKIGTALAALEYLSQSGADAG